MRDEVRGGARAWSGGGASGAQREGLTDQGCGGRRGAHRKHLAHVRDAGRVKAQRLVKR